MNETFDDRIRKLVLSGNKIEAIKLYRERTSTGLAEAKAAVEAIGAGRPSMVDGHEESPEWIQEIVRLLASGQKIAAIKIYREHNRVDLKTAKDDVEAIAVQNGLPVSTGGGCFGAVLAGLIGLVLWFR